ncbi:MULTISPECIES: ROK family protein [unclassified Mesorhizobium]|uniref:ROK family protein n=1 Tax=unclassified Mesorhizobium TaxID=325217 RepID=UPI001CCE39A0|nr:MULTISPECIES: ROK family protein [unclassified Mesorhizobium]MBZ9702023.1 ROK family protein [Mesorhizobium sp. CO1-1-3]MBZ9895618.1 ROK family protein [Mesorhizobium sp. BR1-1-6]MBZ9918872.1 ROK family protein [Mesorhizobium sp. BR1-1-7]MBZ9945455.1 ROK family protein [Mesorhizobium sp. BR1-1-11]MBZ9954016.1 ROK family protein [Mesorhizobium sp. BR1-1-15]
MSLGKTMDERSATDPVQSDQPRRAAGRPRASESAHGSLATLLNLIRTEAATTRQELENQSELGRAVVTDRLATLLRLGLIEEGELGPAIGGRAPRHVRFRPRIGMILAAVLDHSSLAVGVSDLSGRLLAEHHEAVELAAGPEPVVQRLATLFAWMLEEHGSEASIWGIGLAVPGAVEKCDDQRLFAPALNAFQNWDGFPFVEQLATLVGAPVWVRSGVQTMTMGELKSGSGLADMIFVKLGRSISAGVVSEGALHRGAQGAAGMIGHTFIEGRNLEAVAGSEALGREARQAAESGSSPYLAEMLARAGEVTVTDAGHGAQLGDPFCIDLLGRCGRAVGEVLAPLANLLNPSLIVLGGSVAQTGDILLAAVREAVYRQSHPIVTRDLRIVRSQMGGSAGLVGAAQVVAEALFDAKFLQGWITLGSPREHPEFKDFLARAALGTSARPAKPRPPGGALA